MSKHTPGPWTRWTDESGQPIAQVYTESGTPICVMATKAGEPEDSPQSLANAALIAAAPELLSELDLVAAAIRDTLTVTLAKRMDEQGADGFTIVVTLRQANRIAEVLRKATDGL